MKKFILALLLAPSIALAGFTGGGGSGGGGLTIPAYLGTACNNALYPASLLCVSNAPTTDVENHNIGIAGGGLATYAASGTPLTGWGVGVYGKGWANGATRSSGVIGEGMVTATDDTGAAVGVRGYSLQTHAGGMNIGVYGTATGGATNYDFYSLNGTITSATGTLTNTGNLATTGTLSSTSDGTFNGVRTGRGAGNTATNSVGGSTNALANNTTGANNSVGAGVNALQSNTSGNYNSVGAGVNALQSNTTGYNNSVGAGVNALQSNTTGSNNSVGAGVNALQSNTTGANNTALGNEAGYTATPANANVTGSNNTWLGYRSGPGTTTQLNNATAIGNGALNLNSNEMVFGNTAVASNLFHGTLSSTGAVTASSGYTVAALNTAYPAASNKGKIAYVNDALAPAWGATVAGGGAVVTPVFCDGTNWTVR